MESLNLVPSDETYLVKEKKSSAPRRPYKIIQSGCLELEKEQHPIL